MSTTCSNDHAKQRSKVVLHSQSLSCWMNLCHNNQSKVGVVHVQEEVVRVRGQRMEEEARVTELQDVLNTNLLKRCHELTHRLEQADVEADR